MKILLINPAFDYYFSNLIYTEPLSLAYLAANLKKNNYQVQILDAAAGKIIKAKNSYHFGLSEDETRARIISYKPDLVGITCPFSLRYKYALAIAKLVKNIDPNIITVMGGTHPTIFPDDAVQNELIDYVIIGEGENNFLSLIKQIEFRRSASESKFNVDGCAFKFNGNTKLIPKLNFIEELDLLPLPARDLLPLEFYLRKCTILYGFGAGRCATIITSRSCPKRCAYCSMYLSHGPRWRGRSAENVFEEIKLLIRDYNVNELFIYDDNFTFSKDRVMKLCELFLSHRVNIKWSTPNGVAAEKLDEELLTMMKKAGCVNICIGVESGNDFVRNKIIKKGLSESTIANVLRICKKINLPITGFFILGIPGENEATFKDTINMVKNLPFSMIATSFYMPFPGTQLYDKCVNDGYIDKNYWKQIERSNVPIVETPAFKKSDLRRWEKMIYISFFKSKFWNLFFKIITFRNPYFKTEMIKRFIKERILVKS